MKLIFLQVHHIKVYYHAINWIITVKGTSNFPFNLIFQISEK